jgi:hypothetical protein
VYGYVDRLSGNFWHGPVLVVHNSVRTIGSATECLLSQTEFSQQGGKIIPRYNRKIWLKYTVDELPYKKPSLVP